MNRYTLHKAGINISDGMERLKLDKATYEGILCTFIQDSSFEMMNKAIDEKDVKNAFLHAHSLKGLSANLSMVNLYSLISPLVTTFRDGSFERVEELLPPVKEAYQLIIDVLKLESEKSNEKLN